MKRGGGGAKGRAFELAVCRQLSRWWSGGKRDDGFWHTHSSGAIGTRRGRRGSVQQHGDVMAMDAEGLPLLRLCTIEIKVGYGRWCAVDYLDGAPEAKPPLLTKFLSQAVAEADVAGVPWFLLILKRDRRQPMIVVPQTMVEAWKVWTGGEMVVRHIVLSAVEIAAVPLPVPLEYTWTVLRLEHFLDTFKPSFFICKAREPVYGVQASSTRGFRRVTSP